MVPLFVLAASLVMEKAAAMAACWSPVKVKALRPSARRAVMEEVDLVALGVSVRSRSVKVMEPVSLREEPSVMAPASLTTEMTGVSVEPVIWRVMS